MTLDKSLKIRMGTMRNRNVLTRDERIAQLIQAERWKEGDPVLGLPKVRVQKVALKKKKKVKKEEGEGEAGAEGAAAAAPAAK
jgi:small basic protein (TIGR04137 family)